LLREPAPEPARDEDRLALVRDPAALELADRRRDRRLARVLGRTGERQRGGLDEERRPTAAWRERCQRPAGERVAKRVSHGSRDVHDLPCLGRRPEDDVVLGGGHEHDTRTGEERDPLHGGHSGSGFSLTPELGCAATDRERFDLKPGSG
jgi:hypothetical protein